MAQPLIDPALALRLEHCIVHCLTCGRSTTAATFVVEGLFGWLPYGRVTNRLHCRKGCGDKFGMVLPLDAPTPRDFAQKYDLALSPAARKVTDGYGMVDDCRDRLIEVGEGGTFVMLHAKAHDPAIVHWGFDYLLKKFASRREGPPHLIVARGAQWSRDSKRDFKVVAGKWVEKTAEDPDEDEEGYPHD